MRRPGLASDVKPGLARTALLVGVALAGGLASWVLAPSPYGASLGMGLAAGGVLAALVLLPAGVPHAAHRAAATGAATSAAQVLEALALAHRPLFVPATGNLTRERMFLPTSDEPRPLPTLDDATRLYAAPPGYRHGVAVEPPGLALVLEAEAEVGARLPGRPLAEVEAFLAALGARSALWGRVALEQAGQGVVASFAPGPSLPCVTPEGRALCEQGVCPACSAFAVALARALQRPLRLASVREEGGLVRLALEEVPA